MVEYRWGLYISRFYVNASVTKKWLNMTGRFSSVAGRNFIKLEVVVVVVVVIA